MELLMKIEHIIEGWYKPVPHMDSSTRTWLTDNIWWMIVVLAVASIVGALGSLVGLLNNVSVMNSPFGGYYASSTFLAWATLRATLTLVFNGVVGVLLVKAVNPLKEKQQKGWYLVFASVLIAAVSVAVGAFMTLNALRFITDVIFGGLFLAAVTYFLFEVRGSYARVERSKGVKKAR